MPFVLDASALLAFMRGEDGSDEVARALDAGCEISVVNVAEALSKLAEAGDDPAGTVERLAELGDRLQVTGVDVDDAVEVARLRPVTKERGLSLGDRACLALAARQNLPAMTADTAWRELDVGVEIVLIR